MPGTCRHRGLVVCLTLAALVLLPWAIGASAQQPPPPKPSTGPSTPEPTYSISGQVNGLGNGVTATVRAVGLNKKVTVSTTTSAGGAFKLSGLPVDMYRVMARAKGYVITPPALRHKVSGPTGPAVVFNATQGVPPAAQQKGQYKKL